MRKLARTLLVAALLSISLVAVGATPAQAHSSTTVIIACTGYQQVAVHVTAAQNVYAMDANTCVGVYSQGSNSWQVEGVTRFHCVRNGSPYTGCRTDGNIEIQFKLDGGNTWNVWASNPYLVPSTGYFSDSGRIFSGHFTDDADWTVRGKEEGNNVRFLLADGTTVLKAVTDKYSAECVCFN